jgi:DNA-binding XRE family transcriptional regulator
MRPDLDLSQIKFATKLGVSFQQVDRWEAERTKPLPIVCLPIALKQIERLRHQVGNTNQNLLAQYFSG